MCIMYMHTAETNQIYSKTNDNCFVPTFGKILHNNSALEISPWHSVLHLDLRPKVIDAYLFSLEHKGFFSLQFPVTYVTSF